MNEHQKTHDHSPVDNIIEEDIAIIAPRIFTGCSTDKRAHNFDAVMIHLDGRINSTLAWQDAYKQAEDAISHGYAIVWDLQLGLFDDLSAPLANQTQFLSLILAIEHFRDFIWAKFRSHTLALSLFRGSADFSKHFPWNEEQKSNFCEWLMQRSYIHLAKINHDYIIQDANYIHLVQLFCRDASIEYINLLTNRLPDALSIYLFLDASSLREHTALQLLNTERYERFQLLLKGVIGDWNAMGWDCASYKGYASEQLIDIPPAHHISVAVCLPPMHCNAFEPYQELQIAINEIQKKTPYFKIIAENYLTTQWDGLDYLFYSPSTISHTGKRKLQGFCAAGGTVVSMGPIIGLAQEISFAEWCHSSLY